MPNTLDQKFIDHLAKLADDSFSRYNQHVTGRGGRWSMPPLPVDGWDGDLFDFTSMSLGFDRSELEQQYETAILNAAAEDDVDAPNPNRGTLADLAGVKAQIGYLSQRERAFRARHATPIMAACFAAARRRGHGQNNTEQTGVFGNIANNISDILNYGR